MEAYKIVNPEGVLLGYYCWQILADEDPSDPCNVDYTIYDTSFNDIDGGLAESVEDVMEAVYAAFPQLLPETPEQFVDYDYDLLDSQVYQAFQKKVTEQNHSVQGGQNG